MRARFLVVTALFIAALPGASCNCDGAAPLASTGEQIDVFPQKSAAQVDVLWMVDDSPSMASEQKKLAARFREFFGELIASKVDYHVGVVSSDITENGVLRSYTGPAVDGCDGCRYLTSAVPCPNPDVDISGLATEADIDAALVDACPAELVFRNLVQTGDAGGAVEHGFDLVAAALGIHVDDSGVTAVSPPPENAGFVRDDATLYLVFVSDEDEGLKDQAPPVDYYVRAFRGFKGAGNENKVRAAAITGYADDEPVSLDRVCGVLAAPGNPENAPLVSALRDYRDGCVDESAPDDRNAQAETGGRYIELACATGGVLADMCRADYSTALDALGANAAGLRRKFTLSNPVDEMEWGADCTPLTNDDVNLDCDGDGRTDGGLDGPLCVTATALANANANAPSPCPSSDAALVPDHGLCGYAFDPVDGSVTFGNAFIPAPGTEVQVRYAMLPPTIRCP